MSENNLSTASKEVVALQLTKNIAHVEGIDEANPNFRKVILDLYAECLEAVNGNRNFK